MNGRFPVTCKGCGKESDADMIGIDDTVEMICACGRYETTYHTGEYFIISASRDKASDFFVVEHKSEFETLKQNKKTIRLSESEAIFLRNRLDKLLKQRFVKETGCPTIESLGACQACEKCWYKEDLL